MITNRTVEDIAEQWQSVLDTNLETGDTPLFVLGHSPAMVGDLPGELALQHCDEERRDAALPLALAGGLSPVWVMALFHRRGDEVPSRSPGIRVGYTGPDLATHAAALSVWDTRRSPFHPRPRGLSPAFQPHFTPRGQAGAHSADTLPFLVADRDAPFRRDGWVAWGAMALAMALLLIALIA
jgi:hypothetical protein